MQQAQKGLTHMESLFSHAGFSTPPDADTAGPLREVVLRSSPVPGQRTSPTDRASMRRQWQLVLAGALASGEEQLVISTSDLARQEDADTETVTQTVRFGDEVGLFRRVGRGKFAVTEAGWAIAQRWQEDQTYARLLLQGLFRPHWSVPVADTALRPGPLPMEELGRRLLVDLPGKPRRGLYLVDWLALALLVHRDQQGMVWPTPALSAAAGSQVAALPAAAHAAEPEQSSGQELDALMGWTNQELDELAPERFCAFLDNLTQLVKSLPA
ncbi:hypothetical protein ACWDFR_38975 [Streptomyces sp. 900105755]